MKTTMIKQATEIVRLCSAFIIGAGAAVSLARAVRAYVREALEDDARGIDPVETVRKATRTEKP
jgi:hypothetical protein